MSHFFKRIDSSKNFSRGFTVVELITTLGIVTVLLTIILFNQSKFIDGAALSNTADEMGISISQSQAYGIAAREHISGTSNFSVAYGLTASLLSSGSGSSYILFADLNDNQSYDNDWSCPTGGPNECLEKKEISRGNYIYEICAIRTSGGDQCSNIGRVDVTFKRPHTEAILTFYNTSGNQYVPPNLMGARISIMSPSGGSRSVVVYTSGQVSIQ